MLIWKWNLSHLYCLYLQIRSPPGQCVCFAVGLWIVMADCVSWCLHTSLMDIRCSSLQSLQHWGKDSHNAKLMNIDKLIVLNLRKLWIYFFYTENFMMDIIAVCLTLDFWYIQYTENFMMDIIAVCIIMDPFKTNRINR